MDNGIFNGTGFLNAFEGIKTIKELKLGQMFFSYDENKKPFLGMVYDDFKMDGYGYLRFEMAGFQDGVPVFKLAEIDFRNATTLVGHTDVLALKQGLKVDVSAQHLTIQDNSADVTSDSLGNLVGRIAFAYQEDGDTQLMGIVVSSKQRECVILGRVAESGQELWRQTMETSFQFDEWHGVVEGQRVFTVRSHGLCKEKQKEASLAMEASEPEKPSSEE